MKQVVKIIFVSGKGGVGKSTVAAALALSEAFLGRKTLLVELGSRSFFQLATGKEYSYAPRPWRSGVDIAIWDGPSCLKEYGLHFIKSETVYRLFFENQVSKSLIQVAPGLTELAILGKITSGPPRNVGPKMDYDCIVVDAFASGHFLALLRAPLGFSEAIQFGPMGAQTRGILDVLKNPEICEYHFVTLPEELPIQETLELSHEFQNLNPIKPKIVLNYWLNVGVNLEELSQSKDEFSSEISHRLKRQQQAEMVFSSYQKQIAPWIFESDFTKVTEALAHGWRRP